MAPSSPAVFILGSGPTGLAAGVRLARAGVRVNVIERLPWTGGLCKSFQQGPYLLDLGPHRFTPHTKEVFDFANELCPGELDVVEYKADIWIEGKRIKYPFSMPNLLSELPLATSAKLISSFLTAFFTRSSYKAVTYEEWVLAHFGPDVTRLVFRPLIEKVWGTPLTQLSERFARQRIAITSLWETLWEVLTHKRAAKYHSPFYPDNGFLYPKKGYGCFVDAMAREITERGGSIVTAAAVSRITIHNNRVESVSYRTQKEEITENPDVVISTIPIQYFFSIINPKPAAFVLEAASKLKTRRLVILYLELHRPYFSENTSMYFPPSEFPFGRIWEQKRHSATMIPTPDKTVLGLEIPCWESDAVWTADDKTIMEIGIAPFLKYGLLKREEILSAFTVKLGSVYPVWDLEFEKNLDVLLKEERHIENLILNGRPGYFFYNNFHHSLDMGFRSADHVLSGLPKREKWEKDAANFKNFTLVE